MGLQDYAALAGQFDPIKVERELAALKDAQNGNRLADFAFSQKQKEAERASNLERLARDSFDETTGTIDEKKFQRGLAQSGDYAGLQSFEKSRADQAKTRRDADKAQLEIKLKNFELAAQIIGPVKDQTTWNIARKQASELFGPEYAAQMPEQYDPEVIEQKRKQAMPIKDQLEQEWKKKGYDLDVNKFDYQQKNDAANRAVTMRGQDINAEIGREKNDISRSKSVGSDKKPLPASALKMQQEELDAIGTASSINSDLGAVQKQIEDGKLKLGLVNNLANRGKNFIGKSDEESRNFSSFKSTLEKLRNDSLRLNKGVQTEGDAVRAWNELFENLNDQGVVKQRLSEIQKTNERAANLRKMNIDNIRANYGHDPLDTSGHEKQTAAVGASDKKEIPSDWKSINAASKAGQPARDSERLAILLDEYRKEKDPGNRAALEREIKRMGASPSESRPPIEKIFNSGGAQARPSLNDIFGK